MRIIGGRLKGKKIDPPAGYKARPTTDFAREGLFNASRVYSVEMSRENASFIKTEAKRLGLENVTMVRDNVFDFLDICHEKFDIIFADPPYALEGLETLPDKVFSKDILHPGCYFILEHGDEHSFVSHPRFKKEKRYGRVHFSFFE